MSPAATYYDAGTSLYEGSCFAIYLKADAVFTTLTGMAGSSISGVTFAAGTPIYGNFSAVKLASGSALLYFASSNVTIT